MMMNKVLILEDGSIFHGNGFGSDEQRRFEIVFNTSPVGYQEILSDPSYTDQGVVFAYPLIGNYGMNDDDYETRVPTIGAMIVREYNDAPSNYRSVNTLEEIMMRYGIVGISGVDTRMLVRHIRDVGSCRAMIADADVNIDKAVQELKGTILPTDAVLVEFGQMTAAIAQFSPEGNDLSMAYLVVAGISYGSLLEIEIAA